MNNKKLDLDLTERQILVGAWTNLNSPMVCEIIGSLGFDWLLIDAEHGPNSVTSVLSQLQAIAPYATVPVVRIPNHDSSLIKRYLDIGATNLLVPFVDCRTQAINIIKATRYPPLGLRGVGAGLARASRWGINKNYLNEANNEITLIAQIESKEGLNNLEEIAALEEIDALFFGPADIAASFDRLGAPNDPDVKEAVLNGIKKASVLGKPTGIFSSDKQFIENCELSGCRLIGATSDVNLLISGGKSILESYKRSKN